MDKVSQCPHNIDMKTFIKALIRGMVYVLLVLLAICFSFAFFGLAIYISCGLLVVGIIAGLAIIIHWAFKDI